MGRLRGGYLGGSTLIIPGKASGPTDEGPVSALARARIENARAAAEIAEKQAVSSSADHKLKAAEEKILAAALVIVASLATDADETPLPAIRAQMIDMRGDLNLYSDAIADLGPNLRRRIREAQDDVQLLIGASHIRDGYYFDRKISSIYLRHTHVYKSKILHMPEAHHVKSLPASF